MADDKKKSNRADGRTSYDSESTGSLIEFFNKNVGIFSGRSDAKLDFIIEKNQFKYSRFMKIKK